MQQIIHSDREAEGKFVLALSWRVNLYLSHWLERFK